VNPGEQAEAGWRAGGSGAVAVGEVQACGGEGVDIWRLDQRRSIYADIIEADVVTVNDHDIRALGCGKSGHSAKDGGTHANED